MRLHTLMSSVPVAVARNWGTPGVATMFTGRREEQNTVTSRGCVTCLMEKEEEVGVEVEEEVGVEEVEEVEAPLRPRDVV